MHLHSLTLACLSSLLLLASCQSGGGSRPARPEGVGVRVDPFGKTQGGEEVEVYTLQNSNGVYARVMTFGATLTEMWVPDSEGKLADVVLGFDSVAGYESDENPYFGCIVGRCANRIAGGRFDLDGRRYHLATNNPPNHLHGGIEGFGQKVWEGRIVQAPDGPAVEFSYRSPDMEEGYPGNLQVQVTYTLTESDELRIDYWASTDKRTVVNLTHHSYFNLAGHGSGNILGHDLEIAADLFTPTDATLIPTGEVAPVAAGVLDFRTPKSIGLHIDLAEETPGEGYDHNFALRGGSASGMRFAARLEESLSGRVLEIYTSEPGLQFYSGNFLDGVRGKGGAVYDRRGGLCLEAQRFPDAVNQPGFQSAVLDPTSVYTQTTVHRFQTR